MSIGSWVDRSMFAKLNSSKQFLLLCKHVLGSGIKLNWGKEVAFMTNTVEKLTDENQHQNTYIQAL